MTFLALEDDGGGSAVGDSDAIGDGDTPPVRGPPSLVLGARISMLLRLMALCGVCPTHITSTAVGRK